MRAIPFRRECLSEELLRGNEKEEKASHLKSCAFLQISPEIREARRDELISMQQQFGAELARRQIGQEVKLLQTLVYVQSATQDYRKLW